MIKVLRNINKKLLILTIFLAVCGIIMIYSASNVTSFMLYEASPSKYFVRQSLFFIAGLIFFSFFLVFPVKKYAFWSWIGVFGMGIFILGLALYGTVMNGATGWLGYKGYGIQPSEFIKVIAIPFLALYFEKNQKDNDNLVKMLFPFVILGVIALFIILQSDYGTALIYILLIIIMFFISPISKKIKYKTFLVGLGVLVVGILVIAIGRDKIIPSEKLARFNYFNPCEYYLDSGLQLCNGYIAMNGGGITGKGFGNSTQKYLYLPEAYTDFIFPIIVEELGIIGAVVLFILYFILIVMILLIGNNSKKVSHRMICYGVAAYIFLHIFINLGGVLGLIPLTGVPLPFMSYGGSYCLSVLGAIAMVQRVSYEQKMKK